MTRVFRCQLVLMLLGRWGYGDHVRDPRAFVRRVDAITRKSDPTSFD